MAKGYWIANMDVRDAQAYDKYRAANAKPFQDFGAKFLIRGGTQTTPEGQAHPRTVIVEFPSYADALACYDSADYQAAKDIRLNAAEGTLMIVEGYEG